MIVIVFVPDCKNEEETLVESMVFQLPAFVMTGCPLIQIDAALSTFHNSVPSAGTTPSISNSSRAIQISLVRWPVARVPPGGRRPLAPGSYPLLGDAAGVPIVQVVSRHGAWIRATSTVPKRAIKSPSRHWAPSMLN